MKKLLTLIILSFSFLASAQFGLGDSLFTMEYQVGHQMVDIDNDGDLDVLSISNSNILWYENTGDFEFGDEHIIMAASGLLYTSRITLADVNEDGEMDFATAYNSGGSKIGWFENNGDGTFTEHNILSDTDFNTYQYYDDDGDGDYDLVFTQSLDKVSV